ncbi:MAG: glycoside hydrolase, partial [Pigmentiphaga sp.]|nr:glycoside hydrolase [Pigmentiphaga sp.]
MRLLLIKFQAMKKNIILFLFLILTCLLTGKGNKGDLDLKILFETSTDSEVSCYRIPALITANNGNLIVAADERVPSCQDLRTNDNINIVIRVSSDNGKSWSKPSTVIDFPSGQSASDPSFILNKYTGKIFLFYNYMDLIHEKSVYYFHYVESTDNGLTWTQPKDITQFVSTDKRKYDFQFVTSGRGTQTNDGWLLHTLVSLKYGIFVFGSKDHGETWFFNP